MDDTQLERLTRIAGNLPCERATLERCDGKHGEIYFAYGVGHDGTIHACWGYAGLARTLDFKPDTSLKDVRQVLVNDAAYFIEGCADERVFFDGREI